MGVFEAAISAIEKEDTKLLKKNYTHNKTTYLKIDAKCQTYQAAGHLCKYDICCQKSSFGIYADVSVKRTGSHKHTKALQIRNEARYSCAVDMISNYNRSVKRYNLKKTASGESTVSLNVLNHCVSEHNHLNEAKLIKKVEKSGFGTSDWLSRLTTAVHVIEQLEGNQYCRGIISYPYFQTWLASKNQLECILSVAPEDRILHIDATESLVSMGKAYTQNNCSDFKRIHLSIK